MINILDKKMVVTLLFLLLIIIIFPITKSSDNINSQRLIDVQSVGILYRDNPLDEVSGLAASRKYQNVLWTHEDDWDSSFYAININGTILGKYNAGIEGYDVEDIAIGPGPDENIDYLYIGHIGDNNAVRSTIEIRRVPEPEVSLSQKYCEINLTNVENITLQYPDGAKDSETLMVDSNGDIYIVTKRLSQNKIYRASYPQSTKEIITLELVATLSDNVDYGWITAGDISFNGESVILRNDQDNDSAFIWNRSPGTDLKDVFNNSPIIIDIQDEPQGEAICYDSTGAGFYTLSEHAGLEEIPIWYYQLSDVKISSQKNNSDSNIFYIIIILIMIFLFSIFIFTKNSIVHNMIFGLIIIISLGIYASTSLFEKDAIKTENIDFFNDDSNDAILTITYDSVSYNFSLSYLQQNFQSVSGKGGKINQIGVISGLNNYTGVTVQTLVELFDDIPKNYYLIASAGDYEYNFTKDNISGFVEIYDKNNDSFLFNNCTMIIAYKINDELIDIEDGGPLRIAFIDEDGSITRSRMWVSSVKKLMLFSMEDKTDDTINIPPVVSIDASTYNGYSPLTVNFFGNAYDPDGYIESWYWSFGDGDGDNKKDLIHTYNKAGIYLVTLTVTDNQGLTNKTTIKITVNNAIVNGYISPSSFIDPINDWDDPNYALDGNLNTKAQCTKTGFWRWKWTGFLELLLNESIPCNKIRFLAWYHNRWCDEIDVDLFFNNKWNDIYQGEYKDREWEILEFKLSNVSKARVRFHLRQAFLGIDADLYEFEFYRKTQNKPPVADFEYEPSDPKRKQTISFKDKSNDPDGFIDTWSWDFGDGSKSAKKNPSYTYNSIGSYTVTLTITDNEGKKSSISQQILIENQKPEADFGFTPSNPTTENIIYFSDKSIDYDGYIIGWSWDFGDDSFATNKNPTHKYSGTGRYIVKLIVKDNDGDLSEITENIEINPPPKDWNLTLTGISSMIVNREIYESWVELYEFCWTDGNHTWCGVPLWMVVAMVDDPEPEDHIFNETLAQMGYSIRLTAGDGWITELNVSLVAYNDEGYIIANTIDGEVLPEYTPGGHPSWPLHLRGSDIFPPNNIGNIISIEIIFN